MSADSPQEAKAEAIIDESPISVLPTVTIGAGAADLVQDKRTSSRPAQKRKLTRDYPKFRREDDELVKIGWSKRAKEEYEHRAPKSAVFTLIAALAKIASKKRQFTMEAVLPVNADDGTQVPDYQSYLGLAWLRHENLIVQHGRRGYSIPKPGNFEAAVVKLWNDLAYDPPGDAKERL